MKSFLRYFLVLSLVASQAQATGYRGLIDDLVAHIVDGRTLYGKTVEGYQKMERFILNRAAQDAASVEFRKHFIKQSDNSFEIDNQLVNSAIPVGYAKGGASEVTEFVAVRYTGSAPVQEPALGVIVGAKSEAELKVKLTQIQSTTTNRELQTEIQDFLAGRAHFPVTETLRIATNSGDILNTFRTFVKISDMDEVALKTLLDELSKSVRSAGVNKAF